MREGLIFLLSAPSGSGKSTIVNRVIAELPDLERIVTYTTRRPRPEEVPDEEYHFVTEEQFEQMKAKGQLAEWQTIFCNQYGSTKKRLESAIAEGRDLISGYDVLGAAELRDLYPENVVTIFILPPSVEVLRRRLIERYGRETHEMDKRLDRLKMEMSYKDSFKYAVRNIDLDKAVGEVSDIVRDERELSSERSAS
jgi:guanylate kinase